VPFLSDTIRKALRDLLASKGGFVIFSDDRGDFVQFALFDGGLELAWPEVSRIEPARVTPLLGSVPHEIGDDGLYAQFGSDVERAETFTLQAFRELFGKEPQKLDVELELE
jgi:hypothetical protein